jgi:organic hydroperoxide reductase OsmC/OhrA
VGYDTYDRSHTAVTVPATAELALSSDPAFRGDPTRMNPEQLLVTAAVSCQLLSFLAVAARSRLDVVDYRDEAEAEMPEDDAPTRITRITLRPRITVRAPASEDRIRHLVGVAHRECYIANSLRSEIVIQPDIRVMDDTV